MSTRPDPTPRPSCRVLVALAGVGLAAVLVGCSSPAPNRPDISAALVDSGVAKPVADCVATALTRSLSASELQELAERGGGGAPVDDTSVTNDSADKLARAMVKCKDLEVSTAGTTTTFPTEATLPLTTSTSTIPNPDDAQFNTTTTTTP